LANSGVPRPPAAPSVERGPPCPGEAISRASPWIASSFITGAVIPIDGGATAG
jgi:hypothetical protein